MKLTIGIKAHNEERHIAAAVTSALEAAKPFGGEVILADSGSVDRTVEIATSLGARVVQLADPAERSCGAGAQLAFQFAQGEYFYMLDGDMVLHPGFLPAAIAFLDANPDFAAVGGMVREVNTASHEFQIRINAVRTDRNWRNGPVGRLDGGGLYRAAAIRDVGYFADRNLHAFEELELGTRLQSRGWKLMRIEIPAIDHYGHEIRGYRLLWRRLKSGYSSAPGEVLRAALGKRHLPRILKELGHIRNGVVVLAWWGFLLACLFVPLPPALQLAALFVLLVGPIALLTVRRGSPKLGLYSFAAWNTSACGLLTGLIQRRVPPDRPLSVITVSAGRTPPRQPKYEGEQDREPCSGRDLSRRRARRDRRWEGKGPCDE